MKKPNVLIKAILISITISIFIVSLILVDQSFKKLNDYIEAKNQVISELKYQLLHCKLTTINEIKEKQND